MMIRTRVVLPVLLWPLLVSPAVANQMVSDADKTRKRVEYKENSIEEVVVTGEKVTRSLQDTASSVAVMTDAQIEDAALYDIEQVYDRMANVSTAFGNEGFSIRGINHNSITGGGNGGLASLHIDGAVMSSDALALGQKNLWDVEQIEVFRGPQSTNQGRNSLGGAVFIRTNNPAYHADGRYRLSYGTDNTYTASIAYGNGLIDDVLAYRIAIDDQSTDGAVNNAILDDDSIAEKSSRTFRGKLLFEPGEIKNLSVLTTLSYSENENGSNYVSLFDDSDNRVDPFDRKSYANVPTHRQVDQKIAIVDINYTINDIFSFTSITSWNESEYDRIDDATRDASGGLAARKRFEETETLTQEFRLSFDSGNVTGLVGAYYFESDNTQDIDDLLAENVRSTVLQLVPTISPGLIPFADAIASLYEDPFFITRAGRRGTETDNWAIFGNVDYHFNEFVTLFAGLRYDTEQVHNFSDERRNLGSSLPNPGVMAPPLNAVVSGINARINSVITVDSLNNKADYEAVLPKLGVTLNWAEDLSTSFTVQKAYRAGGSGTSNSGNFEYDPEFTTNYEFSLRSQWFDQRLTVNANVFYIDWKDQQVQVVEPIFQTDFVTVNAGKSELKGVELEITGRPTDRLEVFTSIGYTDTEFTRFPPNEQLNADGFKGNEFLASPPLTVAAGFGYSLTDTVYLQMDTNYQDSSYNDVANLLQDDSRTLINGKLTCQVSERIDLALVGRNLLDEDYIALSDVGADQVVWVGAPRMILLQLQGRW